MQYNIKCLFKNTVNIHWYIEKLKINKKNEIKSMLTSFFFIYFIIVFKGFISIFFSFVMCLFVSDNKNAISNNSTKASQVISQKGAFTHKGNISDQITGPIINHIPKSHHKIHILCILSSLVEEISFIID